MSNFPNQEKMTKQEMSVPTQDEALAYLRRWNVCWALRVERVTSEELKKSEEVFRWLLGLIIKFGSWKRETDRVLELLGELADVSPLAAIRLLHDIRDYTYGGEGGE